MPVPKKVLDRRQVERAYPPGTRLFCPKDKRFYQIGTRASTEDFWMMCEDPASRGRLSASQILERFERVKE